MKAFALVSKPENCCWTGPYKVLFAGPGKTDDGREVGPSYEILRGYWVLTVDGPGHCGITPSLLTPPFDSPDFVGLIFFVLSTSYNGSC